MDCVFVLFGVPAGPGRGSTGMTLTPLTIDLLNGHDDLITQGDSER